MVAGVKFAIRSLCTVRTDGDCGALENQVGENLACQEKNRRETFC